MNYPIQSFPSFFQFVLDGSFIKETYIRHEEPHLPFLRLFLKQGGLLLVLNPDGTPKKIMILEFSDYCYLMAFSFFDVPFVMKQENPYGHVPMDLVHAMTLQYETFSISDLVQFKRKIDPNANYCYDFTASPQTAYISTFLTDCTRLQCFYPGKPFFYSSGVCPSAQPSFPFFLKVAIHIYLYFFHNIKVFSFQTKKTSASIRQNGMPHIKQVHVTAPRYLCKNSRGIINMAITGVKHYFMDGTQPDEPIEPFPYQFSPDEYKLSDIDNIGTDLGAINDNANRYFEAQMTYYGPDSIDRLRRIEYVRKIKKEKNISIYWGDGSPVDDEQEVPISDTDGNIMLMPYPTEAIDHNTSSADRVSDFDCICCFLQPSVLTSEDMLDPKTGIDASFRLQVDIPCTIEAANPLCSILSPDVNKVYEMFDYAVHARTHPAFYYDFFPTPSGVHRGGLTYNNEYVKMDQIMEVYIRYISTSSVIFAPMVTSLDLCHVLSNRCVPSVITMKDPNLQKSNLFKTLSNAAFPLKVNNDYCKSVVSSIESAIQRYDISGIIIDYDYRNTNPGKEVFIRKHFQFSKAPYSGYENVELETMEDLMYGTEHLTTGFINDIYKVVTNHRAKGFAYDIILKLYSPNTTRIWCFLQRLASHFKFFHMLSFKRSPRLSFEVYFIFSCPSANVVHALHPFLNHLDGIYLNAIYDLKSVLASDRVKIYQEHLESFKPINRHEPYKIQKP